ncbi:MAG: aldolase/citrate lyase family protein, partial [Actinomycetes bacterium]
MQTPLSRGALLKRVKSGELTVGTFLGLASPIAAEMAAIGGADWVLLDLEHGGGSESLVGATVISSGAYGVPTLVRVESSERIRIGRVLDEGVAGVMVPRLNSAAEVAKVTKHFAYPPLGDRGAATYNRAARWGEDLDALDPAPKAACIIQIETKGALDDVEAIAALPGADILFVGPLDLSFALGMPKDFDNPTFQQALARVV